MTQSGGLSDHFDPVFHHQFITSVHSGQQLDEIDACRSKIIDACSEATEASEIEHFAAISSHSASVLKR